MSLHASHFPGHNHYDDWLGERRRGLSARASARGCRRVIPAELANDMLRAVREQQRKAFEVTPELEAWLLQAADKTSTPLTGTYF